MVELNKTVGADMDADAPAGSINLRSKTAFQRKGRQISWQFYASANSEKLTLKRMGGPSDSKHHQIHPSGNIEILDTFLDGRLGMVASFDWTHVIHERHHLRHTINTTPTAINPDPLVLTQISYADGPKSNRNLRGNLRFGYKENDRLSLALSGQARRADTRIYDRSFTLVSARNDIARGSDSRFQIVNGTTNATRMTMGAVRSKLAGRENLAPKKVILHATHSHTGPVLVPGYGFPGVPLKVADTPQLLEWTADKIAEAVVRAWNARAPGGVAFGLGHAEVGRNRRSVDKSGRSTMYGDLSRPEFSHIEGFEDHDLNLIATYDLKGALTGLIMNIACPAQVTESLYSLSADFWHDTRVELRRRLGSKLFVAAQCSTAGDIAPHFDYKSTYNNQPAVRMLKLKQRTVRQEIAHRLANATEEVLPLISGTIERDPVLKHHIETRALPLNRLTESDVAPVRRIRSSCSSITVYASKPGVRLCRPS